MADKVQLIKEEIERIEQILDDFKRTHNNTIDNGIVSAKKNICKHIKSFIDSLPEEHNENLEEAAQEYAENHFQDFIEVEDDPGYWCSRFGFIAGAEWKKQQDEGLFSEDTWNYIEENYPSISQEEKLRLYDISIKSRLAGATTIKQQMKEHINNIVSCLEEFLQPGFPIFKAGISEEITWLNSLIIKND